MAGVGLQHPDGDPFANEKAPMSLLDRLEANARAEHPELSADMPSQQRPDTSMQVQDEPDDSSLTSDNESQEISDSEDDAEGKEAPGHQDNKEDDSDDESDSDSQADSVELGDEPGRNRDRAAAEDGKEGESTSGKSRAEGDKDATDAPTDGEPKKRRKKQRSPSPAPRPPPKPQTTIRLDITFPAHPPKGGFMVNIRDLARETDQLVENPEPQEDEPLSADEDKEPANQAHSALSASTAAVLGRSAIANMVKPKKRRRRVLDRDEGYDKDDPFVDDSELHLDLVKTCGVPEKEGFFVHQGELPLLKSGKRARKGEGANGPRKRTKTGPAATTTTAGTKPPHSSSSKEMPLPSDPNASAVVDLTGVDDDDSSATPSGLSIAKAKGDNTKIRKPAPASGFRDTSLTASPGASASPAPKGDDEPAKPLDPSIEKMLEDFKPLVAKESFVPKNKFPEPLKEPLFAIGLAAVGTRDFDQSFFPVLTTILPYNKFTLTKLVKRAIYPKRVEMINEQLEQQIQKFQTAIQEKMPAMQEQYESDLAEYRQKHAEWAAQNPQAANAKEPQQQGEEGGEGLKPGEPAEPTKKFKFDDAMKQCLFEILTLDSELVRLQAEKIELEKGSEKVPTEQTARKKLYAKLANFWPEGWITTTLLSREYSILKKKYGG